MYSDDVPEMGIVTVIVLIAFWIWSFFKVQG